MTSMFASLCNRAISGAKARTRLTFKILFALAMCLVGNIVQSFAADCEPNSLQFYMTMTGGCTDGNVEFSGFDYTGTSSAIPAVQAKDISVVPSPSPFEGLTFEANWSVSGAVLDSKITYDVRTVNGKVLSGESLFLVGAVISCSCTFAPGDGVVEADETTVEAYLYTYLDRDGKRFSQFEYFDGVTSDFVTTDISVTAGPSSNAGAASVANVFRVTAAVAAAPEPSTWTLMAAGFAGLAFVGWRKTRRAILVA